MTKEGVVKASSRATVALVLSVVALVLVSLTTLRAVMGEGATVTFSSVEGIPVPVATETSTHYAETNTKAMTILQAGLQRVELKRVKVVDLDALLDDQGRIAGFDVTVDVRTPDAITVEVTVEVTLANGTVVTGSATLTASASGTYPVEVALSAPVSPEDVVEIEAYARPY